jgi:Putative zinc-finger
MRVLTCAATRRRLQAYHDQELPISEQIDVSAHLEWCDRCGDALTELRALRSGLRAAAPGRAALTHDEAVSLQAMVVSRARAERTVSWSVRIREMFDDMHMVYAGLGASAATVACVMVMLSMMRFATSERSLGSNQNPVVVDAASMLMPKALDSNLLSIAGDRGEDEAVFTLSAVVTREGRVVNLELHAQNDDVKAGSSEAIAMKSVVDAISLARFEPARVLGLPVAVNMVWLVAHTTVRATKIPIVDLPTVPVARKRRVDLQLGTPTAPRPVVA